MFLRSSLRCSMSVEGPQKDSKTNGCVIRVCLWSPKQPRTSSLSVYHSCRVYKWHLAAAYFTDTLPRLGSFFMLCSYQCYMKTVLSLFHFHNYQFFAYYSYISLGMFHKQKETKKLLLNYLLFITVKSWKASHKAWHVELLSK